MGARGHIPPGLEGRGASVPGMIRHELLSVARQPLDPHSHSDLLENKMASQAAEIERLARDNHRLTATHVALRQDLVAAQREVQRLKLHIKSVNTESDIQVRVLLDKIAKMESDIAAGENVKVDLKHAHMEAQSLVRTREELTTQIQKTSQELQKVRADVNSLPDLHVELENLRHEHKRLRGTFEYEKAFNVDKVDQLQAVEKNLIGMAREVEKLRAEVLNVEKRAHAPNPYGGRYVSPNSSFPNPVHGGGTYAEAYGRPFVQIGVGPTRNGMVPYGDGNGAAGDLGNAL